MFLRHRWAVEASTYPHFTMIGQSLGSVLLALEALTLFVPDMFIDTMGYAFSLPIFALLGHSHVACYVHYPTISTDMLARVQTGEASFNNNAIIARSWVLTSLKLVYYRVFAYVYGVAGRFASVVMVNSAWTQSHINEWVVQSVLPFN